MNKIEELKKEFIIEEFKKEIDKLELMTPEKREMYFSKGIYTSEGMTYYIFPTFDLKCWYGIVLENPDHPGLNGGIVKFETLEKVTKTDKGFWEYMK